MLWSIQPKAILKSISLFAFFFSLLNPPLTYPLKEGSNLLHFLIQANFSLPKFHLHTRQGHQYFPLTFNLSIILKRNTILMSTVSSDLWIWETYDEQSTRRQLNQLSNNKLLTFDHTICPSHLRNFLFLHQIWPFLPRARTIHSLIHPSPSLSLSLFPCVCPSFWHSLNNGQASASTTAATTASATVETTN